MLVKVPYSRVLGTFFLERTPGSSHGAYGGDEERETTADIYDNPNPIFYTGKSNASFEECQKIYEEALAKRRIL